MSRDQAGLVEGACGEAGTETPRAKDVTTPAALRTSNRARERQDTGGAAGAQMAPSPGCEGLGSPQRRRRSPVRHETTPSHGSQEHRSAPTVCLMGMNGSVTGESPVGQPVCQMRATPPLHTGYSTHCQRIPLRLDTRPRSRTDARGRDFGRGRILDTIPTPNSRRR